MSKINLNVNELNSILENDGVIAFVTDTVWGIGCLPDNERAINKIYEIKGRDRTKPLILMSNDIINLKPYVKNISNEAEKLIYKYFPGAITIITEKSDLTSNLISAGKNTVGIRIPNNEFFSLLCSKIKGHVLATTSANLSNKPSSKSYEEAKNSIGNFVDRLYEDFDCKCMGIESTVVLALDDKIKILRQGSIKLEIIN